VSGRPGITKKKTARGWSYQVRYRDQDGKQRSATFRTAKEAEAFKADIDHRRHHGGLPPVQADKLTFAELAASWVADTDHRHSTARRRDGILDKYLLPALGRQPIGRIRHSTLQSLVNDWKRSGLKPRTIRNHVNILRSILDRAVRDDIIVKNPAVGLTLPKPQRTEPRSLTADECRRLIDAVDNYHRPIIVILLATGCRWSEIAGMDIGDFDRHAQVLHVRNSKTDTGIRSIPIDADDAALIVRHLLSTGRTGCAADDPLFVGPTGKRLEYANFRNRVFNPAVKAAGLTGVSPHDLRRTHATMLVSLGHNVKAVQERMGHASIQTTLTHYASATAHDLKATASAKATYMAETSEESSSDVAS
jgi:integrase